MNKFFTKYASGSQRILFSLTVSLSLLAAISLTRAADAQTSETVSAVSDEDYGKAVERFKAVVTTDPKNALAWHFYGEALEKTNDLIGARKAYQRALELQPAGEVAERTRAMLAKLPLPEASQIDLPSGLKLSDWIEANKGKNGAAAQALLPEVARYLRDYAPYPELLALRASALKEAKASLKLDSAKAARAALPQIAEWRKLAADDLDLLLFQAQAQHISGDMKAAQVGYQQWLAAADKTAHGRKQVISHLVQAQQGVPLDKPAPPAEIKDCAVCPELVLVPGGTFTMGSSEDEPKRFPDESPQHEVSIKAFYAGKFAVTQGEWKAVMGGNPSSFASCGDNCPVERVSWNEAKEYIAKLNRMSGKTYRLLTEAEREYAARAGARTPFWWGDSITTDQANYDGNYTYKNGPWGKNRKATVPVDSFEPNAFGLYNVHGNVWEWVEDCYHENYIGAPTDGSAWTSGECKSRVQRGGSWYIIPQSLRAAVRFTNTPTYRNSDNGFRLARNLP